MNEEINVDNLIEDIYSKIMEKPTIIVGIFNAFFGESNVDMQEHMSLRRFKSWMDCTPVKDYTSRNEWTAEEWRSLETQTITDLSQEKLSKVTSLVNAGYIIPMIIDLKFRGIYILAHFPHVRVTNEHDRYVDINHLYAKVSISADGSMNGGFTLNRSEYTMLHLSSDYMHSHVSNIPTSDFSYFQTPCLGVGPIRDTINTLNREFDEGFWNMFCLELSKYVTVESIAGVPYHKLESLGSNNMELGESKFVVYNNLPYMRKAIPKDKIREFVRYFINSKKLKFNYMNGSYSIGMSFVDYLVLISNEFISWYNEQFNHNQLNHSFDFLKTAKIIREGIIDNGRIFYETGRRDTNRFANYIGKKVCTFKGEDVTITISDIAEITNENKSIFLNSQLALYILNIVLKVLNYRHGREKAINKEGQLSTEVRYL